MAIKWIFILRKSNGYFFSYNWNDFSRGNTATCHLPLCWTPPAGLKIKSHSGQAVSHIAERKIIILSNCPLLSGEPSLLPEIQYRVEPCDKKLECPRVRQKTYPDIIADQTPRQGAYGDSQGQEQTILPSRIYRWIRKATVMPAMEAKMRLRKLPEAGAGPIFPLRKRERKCERKPSLFKRIRFIGKNTCKMLVFLQDYITFGLLGPISAE